MNSQTSDDRELMRARLKKLNEAIAKSRETIIELSQAVPDGTTNVEFCLAVIMMNSVNQKEFPKDHAAAQEIHTLYQELLQKQESR